MYQLQRNKAGELTGILRLADGAYIPLADDNRDYAEYLEWVAAGNTAAEPPPQPIVIPSVTRFQAKAALLNAGYLAQVSALIAAPETPELYKLAWSEALTFERTSPIISTMGSTLGLTGAQIDDLFIAAQNAV